MSGMDVLRERIARALHGNALELDPENCTFCRESIAQADAVIEALGIAEVATIAWDGEPSMSGKPHRMSLGGDHDLEKIRRTIVQVGSMKYKPGARIETRYVTPWERTEEDA